MSTRLDPDADKGQYLPYYPAPEPGPRPLAAILEDLRRPIHPNYLKTKRKAGTDITFIEWHTAIRILERYALGFHYRTRTSLSLDGQHVACDAEIGIPSSDYGITWRGSSGSDEEGEEGAKNYGDATDRAESQALRRAASKFGIGLPLYYDKDARVGRPVKLADAGRAEQPQERRAPREATPNAPTPIRAASVPAGTGSESDTTLPTGLPTGIVINPGKALAAQAFRRAASTAGLSEEEQKALIKQAYPNRGFSTLTEGEWHALEQKCRAMYSDVPAPEEALF